MCLRAVPSPNDVHDNERREVLDRNVQNAAGRGTFVEIALRVLRNERNEAHPTAVMHRD